MLRLVVACWALAIGCRSPQEEFHCTDSAQCTLGADRGVCETTGFCSFPADTCPSGRIYGEGASADLRDQCVAGTTTGALGDWTTWGTGTPVPSRARARAASADHLYLMGGRDPNNVYRMDMWIASITAGSWTASTIPATRGASAAVVAGNHLYLLGGRNALDLGAGLDDVWVSTVDSPAAWTTTTKLCAPRFGLAVVAASGHLFAFGGQNGSAPATTTSCSASIDSTTGSLGPWIETTPLPVPMRNPVMVATEDHVFLVGGCANAPTYGNACAGGADARSDVYTATILPDGTLGEWRHVSTLPDTWIDRGATIYDGRIYVAGGGRGNDHTDQVWSALIEYDGSLGDWTAATPAHVLGSSVNPHRRPGVAAANGRLYVFEYDDFVSETISAPLK